MIEKEAYLVSLEFSGLREVRGPQDHPLIVLSHRLTNIANEKTPESVDVDAIPWCSSWVNLCIMIANFRRNPRTAAFIMARRGCSEVLIKDVADVAGVRAAHLKDYRSYPESSKAVVAPTWSASSLSWDGWGHEVAPKYARRGDLVRLTRKGGGHIAFLDDDSIGLLNIRLHGGNQADQVMSTDSYLRTRLVTIRRNSL